LLPPALKSCVFYHVTNQSAYFEVISNSVCLFKTCMVCNTVFLLCI
jgi:hypothetical protein